MSNLSVAASTACVPQAESRKILWGQYIDYTHVKKIKAATEKSGLFHDDYVDIGDMVTFLT
jgi:hypothetical protein